MGGNPIFMGRIHLLETRASLTTPVSHIGGLVFFFFFARTGHVMFLVFLTKTLKYFLANGP